MRKSEKAFFLVILTITMGIAYGIAIPKLSYYGDDWIYIYNYHLAGAKSFSIFTAWDRPHSAWIYILTTAIFRESATCYHLYVFLMRWISVFLFWEIIGDTFENQMLANTASLLFAVYPGFQQQPIAVEFLMHFTSLALVMLSIRLMQKIALKPIKSTVLLWILSLGAESLALFTCEYFIGLELARPFFLYFTLLNKDNTSNKDFLRQTVLRSLPYTIIAGFYLIWRIFIFSFQTYGPKALDALSNNLIDGIKQIAEKVIRDLYTVLPQSYRMIFSRPSSINLAFAMAIVIILTAVIWIYLRKSNKEDKYSEHTSSSSDKRALILGIALLLLSGIPYWGTFLDVSTEFPWDRSTLSFSPGVALILAICLDAALKPTFQCCAASVLIALCTLFHVQNSQIYIQEAEKMNDYFWQLAWRAPELEEGTIIISDEIPLDRYSDNDISPIVNWQYAPDNTGFNYLYKYFDLDLREGFYYNDPATIVPVDHTYRSHMFTSSTDKTLAIFYKKNGCLQIIDNSNTDYPDLPASLKRVSIISDPTLIIAEPEITATPPKAIGEEPDHGFCYYFQKTSLALQQDDTSSAYTYATEVLENDLHPVYASDLAPLLLSFLMKEDYISAEAMLSSNNIGTIDKKYFCNYWQNLLPSDESDNELKEFYKSHGCL